MALCLVYLSQCIDILCVCLRLRLCVCVGMFLVRTFFSNCNKYQNIMKKERNKQEMCSIFFNVLKHYIFNLVYIDVGIE